MRKRKIREKDKNPEREALQGREEKK